MKKLYTGFLKLGGTTKPTYFWGVVEYRRIRSVIQKLNGNMHLSKIKWLSKKLDVPPQFVVNIIKRTLKGEEGYNIERSDH